MSDLENAINDTTEFARNRLLNTFNAAPQSADGVRKRIKINPTQIMDIKKATPDNVEFPLNASDEKKFDVVKRSSGESICFGDMQRKWVDLFDICNVGDTLFYESQKACGSQEFQVMEVKCVSDLAGSVAYRAYIS